MTWMPGRWLTFMESTKLSRKTIINYELQIPRMLLNEDAINITNYQKPASRWTSSNCTNTPIDKPERKPTNQLQTSTPYDYWWCKTWAGTRHGISDNDGSFQRVQAPVGLFAYAREESLYLYTWIISHNLHSACSSWFGQATWPIQVRHERKHHHTQGLTLRYEHQRGWFGLNFSDLPVCYSASLHSLANYLWRRRLPAGQRQ